MNPYGYLPGQIATKLPVRLPKYLFSPCNGPFVQQPHHAEGNQKNFLIKQIWDQPPPPNSYCIHFL